MNDIFSKRYSGNTGHPQKGEWKVLAHTLDRENKPSGGGWVASFEKYDEALRCKQIIRGIDRLHAPTVLPIFRN